MAIKPTILKAHLDISDMDRHYYNSHTLAVARHSSETDERVMVRLLAFALHAHEHLSFTDGIDSAEDPALWQKDLTGKIQVWIDVGQPDEKRLLKASGRADQVVVYSYARSAEQWWEQTAPKVRRAKNLRVVQFLDSPSLAQHVQKNMNFQCLIQEGQIFLTVGEDNFEVGLANIYESK